MRSYLHRAAQCPYIAVIECEATEQRHVRNLTVGWNPTLHNLVAIEVHRLAFPALASDLRHTDYLIAFAGGYHAEILRFLVDTFACVLHFEFGIAFGAGTAFKGVAQYAVAVPLVTAVGAGNVPFLGAVADMFNTVAVCPIYLCR